MQRPTDSNVTPFPGNLAAPVFAESQAYGLQPGTTPLLAELTETMQSAVDRCPGFGAAAAAKSALRGYVCEPALLDTCHKEGDPKHYRRHLLYADPEGALSIIAVVWMPGQVTPIHGHTAWGAIGVYEGSPFCENFDRYQNDQEAIGLRSKMKLLLKPGDLATVRPGIDDLHRVGNDTPSRAISIHAYGRDLLADPRSLNIVFDS
ncbi:MAG: cysteine dioxygenase family protein [Gammaproteobacteria bacterium]|jgi:predicted metal-dependent enzyme (double-stranded beta helix superfamily)|nr:cysteine dioxygenase family protein [Gammaproteobacteria bacterium]MDP6616008.1 cysteine dioxygenase family protein [Gammaproteobacteria bacterium]MDP6695154.1 cysteine dioxygenase family protein [Gammaproteobacteria bacterium]MDP7042114.1 cysteine dioxygenase family protein [Gammaproteobacteria bacterium]